MKMRKVDEYYNTANAASPDTKLLTTFFTNCTNYQNKLLFSNIWLPVRFYDQQTQKLSDDYTYVNVGLSTAELADLYWAQYSGNYLIGYHQDDIPKDLADLTTRAEAIFKKNVGKYLKLIELEGLEWNPLWNVDGEELRQVLENNGTTDVESGMIRSDIGVQYDNRKTTHNVAAYDTDGVKMEYTDEIEGNGTNVPTGLQRVEMIDGDMVVTSSQVSGGAISHANNGTTGASGSTKYVHKNAKNLVNGAEAEYAVDARDAAFGQALTGGDKMHAEKLIRRGNIGVTKTTELIEDARNALRFSLIQEFFDDINEVILVGIY